MFRKQRSTLVNGARSRDSFRLGNVHDRENDKSVRGHTYCQYGGHTYVSAY
jgi:hypothetical protein